MNWSDIFDYDGCNLIWKIKPSKAVRCGAIAGHLQSDGYVYVTYMKKSYSAHRIIWEMYNGQIPEGMQIDHINHLRHDNDIKNLRLVTPTENQRNTTISKRNKSGCSGVTWNSSKGKWQVQIGIGGKSIHIGRFDSLSEAISARISANEKIGFHENHGK